MKFIKIIFAVLMLPSVLGINSLAQAQSATAAFNVTVVLRTFSEAATADHRCTHRGQGEGQAATMRISCPATVDVQAIASASMGKSGGFQKMNARAGQTDSTQMAVVAGTPMSSVEPIELLISW